MQFFLVIFFIYWWLEGEEYRSVRKDSLFPAKSGDKCRKTQLDIFHVNSVSDILRNLGPHIHVQTCYYPINEIGPLKVKIRSMSVWAQVVRESTPHLGQRGQMLLEYAYGVAIDAQHISLARDAQY